MSNLKSSRYYAMVPKMQKFEEKVLKEIRREQVKRVDLEEYAVGSPRYERLIAAMEEAKQFLCPAHFTTNV